MLETSKKKRCTDKAMNKAMFEATGVTNARRGVPGSAIFTGG